MLDVVHASPNKKEKTRCHGLCHVISVSACNMSSALRLSCKQILHSYPIPEIKLTRTSQECCVTALARTVHSTIIHTCTASSISGTCIMHRIIIAVKNFSVHLSTLVTCCHGECRNKSVLPRRELLRATRASACTHSAIEILCSKFQLTVFQTMFDERVRPQLCIPFIHSCPCNIASKFTRIPLSCQVSVSTSEQDNMKSCCF